jgi:nucleoside-diphosphate-sugar epimerase
MLLVTGATGFLGTALVKRLAVTDGFEVRASVRREVGMLPAGVSRSLVRDVSPDTDWRHALDDVDGVVHLAARVHAMTDGSADPLAEYRRVNVAGTLALARQAAAAGVRRFTFISSIKVNGESTRPGQAFRETDAPAPVDPYGVSKAEAEVALTDIASSTGMEVVVIRPPLVYGPGVKANFLTMSRWLARGIPLPLGAVRENRRSLVGLDNLVDLILRCLHHPAAANQVFLAGDGEDLSTTDLLCRTAAALGVRARLIPVPVPLLVAGAGLLGMKDAVQRLCGSLQVDISKARRVLGWRPLLTVDEGLQRALRPLRSKEMAL